MTGTIDKIKAKVDQVVHPSSHNTSHTTNAGPHGSNVANKADPRVDSDRDGSHNLGATGHTTGVTGTTGTTTGHGIGGHGTSTNAGPHNTNTANKLDPRIDSDRDGSHNLGAAGGAHSGTGLTGSHGTHGTHTGAGAGLTGTHNTSTNAGPHNSNVANKLDPRVDSDRDGSRNLGAAGGAHTGTGLTGSHNTYGNTGTGLTGTHGTSTNAGPHDSNVANKLDPRVDSDRDGSRNLGAAGGAHTGTGLTGSHNTHGNTGTGLTGTHGTHTGAGLGGAGLTHNTASTNAGPHNSNLANKADPRVDSDRDGSRNLGAASHGPHSGTGPAPNTAGPHSSNLANKLDPRIDSDLDGSKTLGQGQGVAGTGHTTGNTGAY